jgi:serine/threonine-protein kinase RsbW
VNERALDSAASSHRITCSAELTNLPKLLALVAELCEQQGLDMQMVHDLRLVAEEACVNVMNHAYPRGSAGPMTLEARADQRGGQRVLVLTLEDQGRPFDPLSLAPVDTTSSAESRVVGGLGVHLIRQLSDRQHYRRDPERGNVFTIEKHLGAPAPT